MGTVIKLFPLILSSIIAVNQLIKGRKQGATKKKLVMDAIHLGGNVTGELGATLTNSHMQAISGLIDATVHTLNENGVFSTGDGEVSQLSASETLQALGMAGDGEHTSDGAKIAVVGQHDADPNTFGGSKAPDFSELRADTTLNNLR